MRGKDEATTDELQIRKWWAQWPFALVGGRCDGKVVLDCDSYKDAEQHAADLAALGGASRHTHTPQPQRWNAPYLS
jgi:hypothetical protein